MNYLIKVINETCKGKNYIEEILSSTEMLIIIFVLLAVVFAAAIATRIW